MNRSKLTAANVECAKEMWRAGHSLGDIAERLGCSVYDLSPWIYSDQILTVVQGGDR